MLPYYSSHLPSRCTYVANLEYGHSKSFNESTHTPKHEVICNNNMSLYAKFNEIKTCAKFQNIIDTKIPKFVINIQVFGFRHTFNHLFEYKNYIYIYIQFFRIEKPNSALSKKQNPLIVNLPRREKEMTLKKQTYLIFPYQFIRVFILEL